jgi:small-conductance mechanosensitive channel
VDDLLALLEARKLLYTLGLLVLAVLLRIAVARFIRSSKRMSTPDRLKLGAQARNISLVVVMLGLIFIWAEELQGFALSMVAIAAALALATKELIMCAAGALLRATSRMFDVGDRIEVHGVRGDVIDSSLLSTTVLEIGAGHQRTGRSVTLPNSLFLTEQVVNETFTDDYVLHVIDVPYRGDDWRAAEARLLEIARDVTRPYAAEAKRHIDEASRHHNLSPFPTSPRITIQVDEPGTLMLLLRVPTRARDKGRVEQVILRRFLGEPEARVEGDDLGGTSF